MRGNTAANGIPNRLRDKRKRGCPKSKAGRASKSSAGVSPAGFGGVPPPRWQGPRGGTPPLTRRRDARATLSLAHHWIAHEYPAESAVSLYMIVHMVLRLIVACLAAGTLFAAPKRSEERRVGKECRSR